jgi:sodium/potassium-transporting ATPase subunit alpha
MKINNLTKDEVLRHLLTSESGLTEEESKKRFLEFGPNEIREVRKTSLSIRFLGQFTHFLAILLWIGAGLAFLSEYLHPGEGMLTLGLAIVGVIFINAVFTFIQEYKAEKSIEKLRLLLPFQVKVIREGRERELPAREIVPGDLIILSEGDKVPADARLIDATYLMVNNAPLTGESEPVSLHYEPGEEELIVSRNIAFAGTTVVSGSGKAIAFATGMRTEFGRIAHLTSAVEAGLSPLQKEIIKVTRIIAFLATITGVVFFVIGHLIGRGFWENFIFAVGIIVANVPEGLLPTVTLSLAMGSQRMARKMALIKTLTSVETLGSVTVICTDKTGTLTQNRMEVKKLWFDGKIQETDSLKDADMLFKIAYLCNNARLIDGQYKGDPTEIALLKAARETVGDLKAGRVFEIPFDSERKRMTTVNKIPPHPPLAKGGEGGFFAFTKGALESVLPLCSYMLTNGKKVPMDENLKKKAMDAYHSLTDMGLRVLVFAYKEIEKSSKFKVQSSKNKDTVLEKDMIFVGLIGLEDPPRPEVPEALKRCHAAGIKVIMITGDGSRTALAIAREIGLVKGNPVVIEGHEFERMGDRELQEKLSQKEIIFARMTPRHKMRVVSILKEEGERVAVTGDGVNDAPALKKADIGIAMGISGTDVAKEAADMILLDDNFATIVNAVEEGRTVYENIQKFIIYIFAHLTPEAVPYILYALLKIPLPLTVMQILAIDLGTETIPALGLGVEPPEAAVMKQPPRPRDKGLVDRKTLFKGYIFLGLTSTIGVLFAYFFVLYRGGWHWGLDLPLHDPLARQATTATFLGIVIMQIGNVFACRTQNESLFKIGILGNRLVLWGILAEIILTAFIIYHPWGNEIFSTSPISVRVWLILIPFAFILFAAEEIRKWVSRKKIRSR